MSTAGPADPRSATARSSRRSAATVSDEQWSPSPVGGCWTALHTDPPARRTEAATPPGIAGRVSGAADPSRLRATATRGSTWSTASPATESGPSASAASTARTDAGRWSVRTACTPGSTPSIAPSTVGVPPAATATATPAAGVARMRWTVTGPRSESRTTAGRPPDDHSPSRPPSLRATPQSPTGDRASSTSATVRRGRRASAPTPTAPAATNDRRDSPRAVPPIGSAR